MGADDSTVDSPARPVSNLLLLEPSSSVGTAECCLPFVPTGSAGRVGVVGVTFSDTPDTWISEMAAGLPVAPGRMGVVSVGERTRSAAQRTDARSELRLSASDAECIVKTVGSPRDLTTLGVRITECFDEVVTPGEVTDVTFCLRSVSALLENAGTSTVFQFLQVLTDVVATEGGVGHYHLDPEIHDEVAVERLSELFDVTVEVTDDGRLVTSRRFADRWSGEPQTSGATASGDRPVVLVVEDEPDLARLFVDWLAEDHVVHWADSCASAIELIDESIDVALVDRMLPDGSGEDVLDEVRSAGLECRVAMLTGLPFSGDVGESEFDAYLEKPIDADDLRRRVAELLDG